MSAGKEHDVTSGIDLDLEIVVVLEGRRNRTSMFFLARFEERMSYVADGLPRNDIDFDNIVVLEDRHRFVCFVECCMHSPGSVRTLKYDVVLAFLDIMLEEGFSMFS